MIKTVKGDDGIDYALSPIRAGQMRDLTEKRTKNPDQSFMVDNITCVFYCLGNGGSNLTLQEVENLDYPTYKKLLDAAQEISGFITDPKKGEVAAA